MAAIDASFSKRRKASETAIKIASSTATNKSRLRVLQAREGHLHSLFEAAREQILLVSQQDEARYGTFLEESILEALLKALEPDCTVQCRPSDLSAAESAAEKAKARYMEMSGREVSVKVEAALDKEGAGGVRLSAAAGRIKMDNTLDERLALLEDAMLPEIRVDLFGRSETRKFYA